MSNIQIPVDSNNMNYTLRVELDEVEYQFTFRWNDRDGSWFMAIADVEADPIAEGIPVRVGVPLLRTCTDIRKPTSTLLAIDTTGADLDPGQYDLGERVIMVYGNGT